MFIMETKEVHLKNEVHLFAMILFLAKKEKKITVMV